MKVGPHTVRGRLTLWHAAVLAAIVCVFSAAIFLLVRLRLYDDLDARLARDAAAIEATYRDDPGELAEAESRAGIALFEVIEGAAPFYRSGDWIRRGFDHAAASR
jgi:hypothetical protein